MSPRPEIVKGETYKKSTPCGSLYATLNKSEGKIIELFCHLGKSGTCARAYLEALGRVISLAIRQGVDKKDIANTLKGIRCLESNEETKSCPHVLSVILSGNKEDVDETKK